MTLKQLLASDSRNSNLSLKHHRLGCARALSVSTHVPSKRQQDGAHRHSGKRRKPTRYRRKNDTREVCGRANSLSPRLNKTKWDCWQLLSQHAVRASSRVLQQRGWITGDVIRLRRTAADIFYQWQWRYGTAGLKIHTNAHPSGHTAAPLLYQVCFTSHVIMSHPDQTRRHWNKSFFWLKRNFRTFSQSISR